MSSGRSLRLSYDAQDDLIDILAFTIQTWDEDRAEAYKATILGACQELAAFPSLGPAREDLGTGVRTYVIGQHVLVYRVTETELVVSRIIHVRRDLERGLRE